MRILVVQPPLDLGLKVINQVLFLSHSDQLVKPFKQIHGVEILKAPLDRLLTLSSLWLYFTALAAFDGCLMQRQDLIGVGVEIDHYS